MEKILRNLEYESASFRAFEEDGERYLEGYASVFNKRSKPIFENNKLFVEIINRNAFDEILQSENLNVILTFNHFRDRVMARTKSGTLVLSTDDYGLKFRAKVPNTTLGNDVYELVSRGDLFENSFGYAIRKGDDEWSEDVNGTLRTVNNIARLYDVSVVVDGAFSDTNIHARDEDEIPETIIEEPIEEVIEEEISDKDELERMAQHVRLLKLKY